MAGPDLSEAEQEVVLQEQQPVVRKEVVPRNACGWAREGQGPAQGRPQAPRKERIEPEQDPPASRR
jgi:hypothetical protein